MKRSTVRSRTSPERSIAWRADEYAALRTRTAYAPDDRVSDDIFDVEDERAEVDIILNRMINDAN